MVARSHLGMNKYKFLEELGHGTCGSVFKAIHAETFEIVAVKKMKRRFYSWDECMGLREVKVLCRLDHPNIIKLKEVVRENDELFFIFEFMEFNLYQMMKERGRPFSEDEIRNYMTQLLQGLGYMHSNGYFHRDLKPENLLVTKSLLKIADFGLSREILSTPPYTEYVSTRWYRAPEVLFQSSTYTPAIDMWAVGALMAELFMLSPIFPGESEIDQLHKICRVLGAPDWKAFPEAQNTSRLITISCFKTPSVNLCSIIPNASAEAIDLIMQLCSWNPSKRLTAEQSLRHPFFHANMWIPYPLHDPLELKLNSIDAKPNLELSLWDFGSERDDLFLGLTLAVNPSVSNFETASSVSRDGDILLNSDYTNHQQGSVFWSLLSPNESESFPPVEQSLSLSFSSMQHSSVPVPQSSGFTFSPLQSSIADFPLLLSNKDITCHQIGSTNSSFSKYAHTTS